MKKSQVLAALALAFALGVTPIISTVNTASAFTVADSEKNVKGSATQDEVKNAIAAVKGTYPAYNNMVALSDLLALTGDDAIKTTNALTADMTTDITTLLTTNFNVKAADASKITSLKAFTDQIKAAVKAANGVSNYGVLAAFFAAEDDAAFRASIPAINSAFGTKLAYNSNVTIAANQAGYITDITAAVNAKATGDKTGFTYANYEALYEKVSTAQEAIDQYSKDYNRLTAALKADGVLSDAGRTALAAELAKDNPTIAAINTIANTAGDLNNYAAWVDGANSVKAAVTAAAGAQDFASEYNYTLVLNIAKALQVAVPVLDKNDTQIAEQLVGYKGGSTGDGTNKPDDEKDPSAPDTGILSNTEASASTTLAMVAGIATALTAAGAGVVAYRNARRSSRK